ncbi:MAG: T9SS type A sorting domain-containing protein [Janthinobacterium lividum]
MHSSLLLLTRGLLFVSFWCLFGTLRVQADCTTPRLIRSAQNGSFNTGSTWVGGVVPTSCDFVIVDHTVTLDVSFTVGQTGTGGLTVNNGGTLTGSQTVQVTGGSVAYTFTNNGTLNINDVRLNGGGTATFVNNATATLNGIQTWDAGSYVVNKGYLTVNGNINQASGTLRNDAVLGTLTVSGTITLNGTTKWDNTGRIVSTSTDTQNAFFLSSNGPSFYNRPTGRLKMLNGGLYQSSGTTINNENYMGVLNLETHDGALMMNTDSLIVGGNFINGDIFSNYAGANIKIGANLNQINKTNSILSNDGFIQITGNFSNDKAIGGNGGGYVIGAPGKQPASTSTNTSNGQVTGTVDICTQGVSGTNANGYPNIFTTNNNTTQGTNYGISTTTTSCQYVIPTASLKSADITGNAEVCSGSTGNVYLVPAVSGATKYVWTVPSGYTITATSPSGTLTNSNTTATINTSMTSGSVSITVTAGSTEGVITVKTVGSSAAAYNYTTKLVKISAGTPGTPGTIMGPGNTVCSGSNGFVFSIASVSGASTYSWTVPTGWTINYGQGTTSISATSGSGSGSVTVRASNNCGTSAAASYAVASPAALTAPTISGPTSVCSGSGYTYTASAVSGATRYVWTVPSGWNLQSGQGTTSITVSPGTNAGNVTVAAMNGCGTGPTTSYAVVPSQQLNQPQLTGSSGSNPNNTTPCANNGGYVYTTQAQAGVTYNWTLPSGWVVTAPAGISGTSFSTSTNSITVTPSGTTPQQVAVSVSNSCGGSYSGTPLSVTPQAQPATPTISSTPDNKFCSGVIKTFNLIAALPNGTTAAWTVPTGWTINSGQGSASITATPGTTAVAGNVTATLSNSNGCVGPAGSYAVVSNSTPPTFTTSNNPALPMASMAGLVYSINAVSGASSYNWTVPTGWVITSPTGATNSGTTLTSPTATSITVTSGTAGGTVSVSANNTGCTSAATTKVVDINQPTAYAASAYSSVKKTTCYTAGDVLYGATDGNGAITSATVNSPGSLPAGVALASNGALSVSNPASLPTGTASSFTVTTTDAANGQTATPFSLTFNADQAATQTAGVYKSLENYANGDVLTTYTDPDGAITSIALASGTLPPGTALQISGTNGVLIVTDRTKLSPGAYSFVASTSNATCSIGTSSQTTSVSSGNSKALPVVLTYFTGKVLGGSIQLTWGTASELNSLLFEVQRSADGLAFTTIDKLAGAGNSLVAHAYYFTDKNPFAGNTTVYYRLRQVDFDGTDHYSPVLVFLTTASTALLTLELAPNPVRESLYVQVAGTTGFQELAVYSVSGKLLLRQSAEATCTLPVQLLPAGMYLLQVRTADGQTLTRRFVKE